MEKNLKNKAVALAVVASMAMPEVSSVATEIVRAAENDAPETVSEEVAVSEDDEAADVEESEITEEISEDITEDTVSETTAYAEENAMAAEAETELATVEIADEEVVGDVDSSTEFAFEQTGNISGTIEFDYLDPISKTKTFESTTEHIKCQNGEMLKVVTAELYRDSKCTAENMVPGVTFVCADANSVKVTIPGLANDSKTEKFWVKYDGKIQSFQIEIKKVVKGLGTNDNKATVFNSSNGGELLYNGESNEAVYIKSAYVPDGETKAAAVTSVEIKDDSTPEKPNNLKTVTIAPGVKEIVAIPECVTTLILPASVKEIGKIDMTSGTIYYNGDSDFIKEKLPGDNKVTVKSYGVATVESGTEITMKLDEAGKGVTVANSANQYANIIYTENYNKEIKDEDVLWVIETPEGNTSGNAKFIVADKAVASASGKDVTIGQTKSAGNFNSNIVIKAVSKTDKSVVYALAPVYISPKTVSQIKLTENSKITDASKSGYVKAVSDFKEYNVTVAEGASFKIPAVAVDGQNKTLIYETASENITVINGVIKVLKKSETVQTVNVYPQDKGKNSSAAVKINVKTVDPVTASKAVLTASANSLTLVNNETRTIMINGAGLEGDTTVTCSNPNVLITGTDADEKIDLSSGSAFIDIKLKEGGKLEKSDSIVIENKNKTKKVTIKLASATTYMSPTKLSEPNAKKLVNGVAEINIAKGDTINLGVAVQPVTAESGISWTGTNAYAGVDSNGIVSAYAVGNATISGVTTNAKGGKLTTKSYKINVYENGSSIAFSDADYVIQGGFLMTKEDSEGRCTKEIKGGKIVEIEAPKTLGKTEEIEWTSSNNAAVSIERIGTKLNLALIQPGTYTITGVSKYSKQKFSFKINVVGTDDDTKFNDATEAKIQYMSSDGKWKDYTTGDVPVEYGKSLELRFISDVCGVVTAEVSSGNNISVDSKFVVKTKDCSNDSQTVTFKTYRKGSKGDTNLVTKNIEIKVTPPSSIGDIVTTIPGFIQEVDGAALTLKATVKGIKSPSILWKVSKNGTITDKDANLEVNSTTNKCTIDNLRESFGKNGESQIKVGYIYPEIEVYGKKYYGTPTKVEIFNVVATKATVHAEDTAMVKRFGTKDKGLDQGDSIVIDFTVQGKDGRELKNADDADVIWTSSNEYLATAKSVNHGSSHTCYKEKVKGNDSKYTYVDVYGKSVQIEANNNGYTGPVVLTGTFVNSGKKVSIKMNIK